MNFRSALINEITYNQDMSTIQYRQATESDLPFIARILADWQTEEYWNRRVAGYFHHELHPQKALLPRIIYVATISSSIVGFIAGHLTERFGCDGELQWINVIPQFRKTGIATELLHLLAAWFVERNAFFICVDPGSEQSKKFYTRSGAKNLNEHWLAWNDISVLLKNKIR
jgi:GNAT superfamily N-acetyltransferase